MYICTIESPCCVPETLLSQLYFNEKYIFFKVLIRLINKDIRSWGKIGKIKWMLMELKQKVLIQYYQRLDGPKGLSLFPTLKGPK